MKASTLNRNVHYWLSAFIAVPVLILLSTGILLQTKKHWSWIQPKEQRGSGAVPRVDLEQILSATRSVRHLNVEGWQDVNRLDVRPGRGLAKVSLHSGWEVQVDLGTGRVLGSAVRRSDVIEAIHDGSFFAGDASKLGIFLPSGVALLVMTLSGLWLFWQPIGVRRKRMRAVAAGPQSGLRERRPVDNRTTSVVSRSSDA